MANLNRPCILYNSSETTYLRPECGVQRNRYGDHTFESHAIWRYMEGKGSCMDFDCGQLIPEAHRTNLQYP